MLRVEICVETLSGALAAEAAGADRIELCAALSEGGLTPSIGLIAETLRRVRRVGVQVMIRARSGNFLVSPDETRVMLADIDAIRALGAPSGVTVGFVFGALAPDRRIDARLISTLLEACQGAPVTFHKAFDEVRDLAEALETLVELHVTRVLTSGGAATASEGAATLAALVRRAAGRLTILAGGGVRAGNVRALLASTGVAEVHLRASNQQDVLALLRASE